MALQWTTNAGGPGFGMQDVALLRSEGRTDAEIKDYLTTNRAAFGGSGLNVGPEVRRIFDLDSSYASTASNTPAPSAATATAESYQQQLESTTRNYESQLESMRSQTGQLQSQLGSLQTQLISANASRNEAQQKQKATEDQYNQEREIAMGSQLQRLRAGLSVGGTGGIGEGSVTAGRPTYRSSSASEDLLTDYKKRIISSGADSTSQVSVVPQMRSQGGGDGGGGRQRGSSQPTNRAALSSYYSRRFR